MRPANGSQTDGHGAALFKKPDSWTGRVTRAHVVQLILFGVNGVSTGIVYSAAVWSLIAMSPRTFELDVLIAYAIGLGANYLGARLVFKPTTGLRRHALRYLSVVAANFLTTAVLAWWLHRTGVANIISVYLPVMVTAAPTFVLMRRWVFNNSATD